jgi:hypothetical protein
MQTLAVGFQVSLELTKVLPVREALTLLARYTVKQVLDLARNLKNSNSDILVEADLVAVFGRVRIDDAITRQFRSAVVGNTATFSIPNSPLELRQGAGPTLENALKPDSDEGALPTIIQLSLLSSTHDRSTLASALSYGINKRVELGFPSANPSPGYDGILGTLEAISSQSPVSFWSPYIQAIRDRITPVLSYGRVRQDAAALPSNLLFACLDSLCMIQRWPEEYTLTVSDAAGCVTLILWAHHLLGLPVLLRAPNAEDDVYFRHDPRASPKVIIHGSKIQSMNGPEICLLGTGNEVRIRIDPTLAEFVPIEARERVPLAGYSTIHLCRHLEMPLSKAFEAPQEFEDAAHFSVAIAISILRRMVRETTSVAFSIKAWQIWEAVSVLFDGVNFEIPRVEKYADTIPSDISLESMSLDLLPSYLQRFCKEKELSLAQLYLIAIDVLVMAMVPGIVKCRNLPLITVNDFVEDGTLQKKLIAAKGPISLSSTDIFNHLSRQLLGPSPTDDGLGVEEQNNDIFVVSDFGWTIYLPTFGSGDCDPSHINPESVFIREGVPTDKRTGERKSFIRDATAPTIEFVGTMGIGPEAVNALIDSSVHTYKPRCVSPVYQRYEFYGSKKDGFHVMLKFHGTHMEPPSPIPTPRTFTIQQAYRSFHDSLWRTHRTQRCDCPTKASNKEETILPIDAGTAVGQWSWHTLERAKRKKPGERYLPERVIIVLVHGDRRARWLAVGAAWDATKTRQTMLRGLDCCVSCAVNAALQRPGRWFVII